MIKLDNHRLLLYTFVVTEEKSTLLFLLIFYLGRRRPDTLRRPSLHWRINQMARVTPEEFQEKHARRLKASVPDIQRGIERLTVSPTEQAAKKKDKMKLNINDAIDSGRWERNLRKVTLEAWRQKAVQKGLPRISTGIDGAAEKVRDFASQLLPHVDAGSALIKAMPDLTLDDNIARMTAHIRHMAKFKKR